MLLLYAGSLLPNDRLHKTNYTLTDKDWEALNSKLTAIDPTNYLGTALRDLFGLGCYLHFSGAERAGRKTIRTAMEAVGFHKSNKTIFHKIMDSLASNERRYFDKISAHSELYDLWQKSDIDNSELQSR